MLAATQVALASSLAAGMQAELPRYGPCSVCYILHETRGVQKPFPWVEQVSGSPLLAAGEAQ